MSSHIKLTRDLIDALRTNGSFTKPTIEALGLSWETLSTGWIDRLEGTWMPVEQYQRAKATVGLTAKEDRKIKKVGPALPFS